MLNVNAHALNLCHEDGRLRDFFAEADVVFCDGTGVRLAARMLGERPPERITYADWLPRLAVLAEERGFSLFFLGARPGVAGEAARRLRARHPGLKIVGVRHGYFDHRAGSPENGAVVAEINAARPDVLLVGLGMPLQERWLMENRHRLDVGVALTGGAVFDYASGRLRRGPRLLTDNGLEWLARLSSSPAGCGAATCWATRCFWPASSRSGGGRARYPEEGKKCNLLPLTSRAIDDNG
jgi:N-acetylglucosaminyldiphosphoundecaprenol N-acetyl-beta-D-mannosaminyltransferase